ncbi:MAG: domain S-box protein [Acidimicrobiales bacterium]|nr:domain S-box protein [Acidimicrobiales bacterium]
MSGGQLIRQFLGFEAGTLDRVRVAVIFTDLHGRLVECNSQAEALYGWPREELLGRRTEELGAKPLSEADRAAMTSHLFGGQAWEGDVEVRRKDGSIIVVHSVDSPFLDDDGSVVGVVNVSFDVTDRRRAEDVTQFMAEATGVLMASLDYGESLQQLARLAVPFLGDLCLVDVADGPSVVRMAAVHADPTKQSLVDRLGREYPPDPVGAHPAVQTMVTGETIFAADMTEEFLRATTRDDEHFRIVRELGFASYICVPLVARGKSLGTLTVVSCDPSRRFGPADVAITEDLAWRASLAVDNARLFSERAYVARTLQASLLPHSLPEIPGVEVAARYLAAGEGNEVGGDFFDAFDLGYGTWAVVIGDVCGKGADAAAIAGLARHTVRAAALKERRPSRMLAILNEAILREDVAEARFCTVCAALVRPNRSGARLTIASGGHPLPWVARADGTTEQVGLPGLLNGAFDQAETRDAVVDLKVGDTVVLYTDGVVEERDDDYVTFGQERLSDVLAAPTGRPASQLVDDVVASVTTFSGRDPRDDIAVLALRVTAPRVGPS